MRPDATRRLRSVLPVLVLGLGTTLVAADAEPAADAGDAGDAGEEAAASNWSHEAEIGLFLNSLIHENSEDSRDPTIQSSNEHVAYVGNFNGTLAWEESDQQVEQLLRLEFGRRKDENEAWEDSHDLIDYDGTYRYRLTQINRLYGAWGLDSVFTGEEPEEHEFDPTVIKVSAGFLQLYKRAVADTTQTLEWRVGTRVQRRFGHGLEDFERDYEVGIEALLRLTHKLGEDLDAWFQTELFSEIDDPGHVTALITAGATYKITDFVAIKVGLRAYHETEPDDALDNEPGYDEWSLAQDTQIGLVYSF